VLARLALYVLYDRQVIDAHWCQMF
jgi:hypothetical protein